MNYKIFCGGGFTPNPLPKYGLRDIVKTSKTRQKLQKTTTTVNGNNNKHY